MSFELFKPQNWRKRSAEARGVALKEAYFVCFCNLGRGSVTGAADASAADYCAGLSRDHSAGQCAALFARRVEARRAD